MLSRPASAGRQAGGQRSANPKYWFRMPADSFSSAEQIRRFYRRLAAIWGPQHWWPAETGFEVIVGAYLTQNTSWTNVERAVANLRAAGKLTLDAMREIPLDELETLVRPAGYFRQKAQRLKNFVAFLDTQFEGRLDRMFAADLTELRRQLLQLNGVGPETADSILLYAGNLPVFVVDAYTRRILERHQLLPSGADYESIRALFERALGKLAAHPDHRLQRRTAHNLAGAAHASSSVSGAPRPPLAQIYNEMHALIVGIGKNFCLKKEARCKQCPLSCFLPPPPAVRSSGSRQKEPIQE